MKPYVLIILLFSFTVTSCASLEQAKDKAKEEAEEVFTEQDNPENDADGQAPPARAKTTPTYDFKAGGNLVFQSAFSQVPTGNMPKMWKTSGSGQVVTFPGVKGKWLLMAERSTYKLDSLLTMPQDFTIEFDVLTRSDQADDLNGFSFGFAHDNSVKSYIGDAHNDNAITNSEVYYINEEITSSSSATEVYYSQDFNLASYANTIMHVAIQVEGSNMEVYLDKTKVLDTKMFNAKGDKYFYISSYYDLENGAQQAIGNFTLAK